MPQSEPGRLIQLTDDDGYVRVTFGDTSVDLDLLEVYSKVREFHAARGKEPDTAYFPPLLELMQSMGLPRCSWDAAAQFVRGVFDAVDALKKKRSASAPSAASTASTPPG